MHLLGRLIQSCRSTVAASSHPKIPKNIEVEIELGHVGTIIPNRIENKKNWKRKHQSGQLKHLFLQKIENIV